MSNDTRILRDKRLYENQVVVDIREELDVCVLSGMLLTEVSDYFRNLDQDLSSRYPGKHFRVNCLSIFSQQAAHQTKGDFLKKHGIVF